MNSRIKYIQEHLEDYEEIKDDSLIKNEEKKKQKEKF